MASVIQLPTRLQMRGCLRHVRCSAARRLASSNLTNSRAQKPEKQTFVTETYRRGNEHEQRRPLLQATAANSNDRDEKNTLQAVEDNKNCAQASSLNLTVPRTL